MSPVSTPARRNAAAAAVGALALGGLVALSAAPAHAFDPSCNPAEPVLKTLKVSPTKVNVKTGERTVVVTGTTAGPALEYVSVSADPVGKGNSRFGSDSRVKGGAFKVKIRVPKGASNGKHELRVSMSSGDNYAWVTPEQLAERGLPHSFNAVSKPDHKAPKLKRIKLSKKSVNTTKKTVKFKVTASGSDKGGSGLDSAYVQVGNGTASASVYLVAKKGKLTGTAVFPKWAGKKKATVVGAAVSDKAGNVTRYGKDKGNKKLTGALKPKLKVKSKKDTKSPKVVSASATPTAVTVGARRWELKYAVKASDSQSGVAEVTVGLRERDSDYDYLMNREWLVNKKGVWRSTSTIACYAQPGTYDVVVTVTDNVGRETVTNQGTVTFTE